MVTIPLWLRKNSDVSQTVSSRNDLVLPEAPARKIIETNDSLDTDIPIFCAGGCGEVVGYLNREQTNSEAGGYSRWCPACAQANATKGRTAEERDLTDSTDELVGLRKPNRNRGWWSLLQAVIVAIIIAGSVCIAMGSVIGVYLAGFGTLAWCAVYFGLRKFGG